ncbi:MAG: hypothetical protein ACYDBP_12390 [Leptospirales bacterium]
MICPSCGGQIFKEKDFSDYGPTLVDKCKSCSRTPGEKNRIEDSSERMRIRAKLEEVLLGHKTTDYPLENEKIGDLGNDEEAPAYRNGNLEIPKKKESSVGRKTQSDLATIRRNRLKILSDRIGGAYRAAKKYPGLSAGTLGNVLRGKYTMGYRQARKIEEAVGLPSGWMDGDTPEALPESVEHATQENRSKKSTNRKRSGIRLHQKESGENALPAHEKEISAPPPLIIYERTSPIPSRSLQEILSSLTMNPRVLKVDLVIVTMAEAP